ncbi:MAG: RNA polymerase factor sigma-54 [Flavobacteriaceae bacterium]|nr:RNA polymerase factor sigma-54 [Flavobacteriaceae bacterium]
MLKQKLDLKLSQKLSPQQIQLMKLIQLPTLAFEQKVKQEIEENPALESESDSYDNESHEDEFSNENEYDQQENERIETDIDVDAYLSDDEIPAYRLQSNNYSVDDDEKSIPYASGTSFIQQLIQQLNTYRLSEEDYKIASFLIGSIDDSGYIRRSIEQVCDDMAFSQNIFCSPDKAEKILMLVQELDPPGVGARSLQECLMIQLERKTPTKAIDLALEILDRAFDAFTKKHYSKLLQRFDIDEDELKAALLEISKLNPKPGGAQNSLRPVEQVVPDFSIRIEDGELQLTLNGRNAPQLNVSQSYRDMMKGYQEAEVKSKQQKEAVQFIKQKLDAAKWFIDAIKQRQQTLYLTMNAIMQYQKEYFLTGDERNLRPMILKDIADEINMDISTVSRVANSKYVDTPYGTKLIKEFFSESILNEEGEEISTIEIKKILEKVIQEEDKRKPLTDERLAKILKEKGYPIARRTVAKYREQLDLPVARLRKEL